MSTSTRILIGVALLLGSVTLPAHAQDGSGWAPPSRGMPEMPRMDELGDDWLSPRSTWFRGVDRVSGLSNARIAELSPMAERRPGSDFAQVVRFSDGPVPVVMWGDRNGDSRADLIEIYAGSSIIIQLVDGDYDGDANVLRVYDRGGELLSEKRME